MEHNRWHDDLLAAAAGSTSSDAVASLKAKLGDVPHDGGASFGTISPYFCKRYGFASSAQIIAFTGDNPSTMLALPLRSSDAIVSLGTSTTFLMSTDTYKPSPAYHFMNHPTTPGLYMFMLCYKNGGLAREHIRDALNADTSHSWSQFNATASSTAPLGQSTPDDPMRLALFFPRPEIVPNVKSGTWRHLYNPTTHSLTPATPNTSQWPADADARAILESQFLSLRLRSAPLVHTDPSHPSSLPPQPRRIYLVGGGAANPAIAALAGSVLGGTDGVFQLSIGGNACALGAAYKAAWGVRRAAGGETFEDWLEARWDEGEFVRKVDQGYREGVWEKYGQALGGFEALEGVAVREKGEGVEKVAEGVA
jgi:xylulokinase